MYDNIHCTRYTCLVEPEILPSVTHSPVARPMTVNAESGVPNVWQQNVQHVYHMSECTSNACTPQNESNSDQIS